MPQSVHQDVFPATVAITASDATILIEDLRSAPPSPNTHQINTARVIVTNDQIIIATDGPTGPQLVFQGTPAYGGHYKNPDKRLDSYVLLDNGQKIAFRRDSACGCGSRLRSWNPYNSTSSILDPTE